MVDGSLLIQEGNDLWMPIPRPAVSCRLEIVCQRSYDDTLPRISEFFRDIVAVSTMIDIAVDASDFVGVFHRDPTVFASVSQRPLDTDLTSPNPSTKDSRVFFTTDDTPMGVDQILMPTAVTPQDFREPLTQLRAVVSQISTERVQTRNDSDRLQDMLFMEEIQIQKSALSLDILASQRKLITQQAAIAIVLDDIRKDVDETKAALSNAILDFYAQEQENYNNISSQLGELVAYINREEVVLVKVAEEMIEGVLQRKGDPIVVVLGTL
ncbi:hypothetical protein F511_40533 [Dorcoceras hygrometricum]|uniref:Uncharacterized protein n=1 Tax=Dorcoceras hygrometricum TaxID=472368 RepID=A0A2Z7D8Q7_9LAMI|nr:hypothetical protein F511_40533 [Dorcoceras hygrometricum]